MSPSFKRATIAVLAWPLGVLMALFWLIGTMLDSKGCSSAPGDAVIVETCTMPVISLQSLMVLVLAFLPGILATRAWWKGRRDANEHAPE